MVSVIVVANLNSRGNRKDKHRIRKLREVVGNKGEVIPTKNLSDLLNNAVPRILKHKPAVVACDSGDGGLVPLITALVNQTGVTPNSHPHRNNQHPSQKYFPLIAPTAGGTQNVFSKRCGLTSEEKVLKYLSEIIAKESAEDLFIENIDFMKVRDDRGISMYGFTFGLGMPVTLLEEYYKKKDMRYAQLALMAAKFGGSYLWCQVKQGLGEEPHKEDFFYAKKIGSFYEKMNAKIRIKINDREAEEFLGIMAQTIPSIGIKGTKLFFRAEKADRQFHVIGTKANIQTLLLYSLAALTGNPTPVITDHLDLQTNEIKFSAETPFHYQVNGELEYLGKRLEANEVKLVHGLTLNIVKTKNTP